MENQLPQKRDTAPYFGPCLLWPNGWMHQDTTWYGGRHRPRRHCVRCGPAPPKRGTAPILSPCVLWPNGWMDQDASWYGGSPRPWRRCVRCAPRSPPQKKKRGQAPCLLWPNGRPSQLLLSSCWYFHLIWLHTHVSKVHLVRLSINGDIHGLLATL